MLLEAVPADRKYPKPAVEDEPTSGRLVDCERLPLLIASTESQPESTPMARTILSRYLDPERAQPDCRPADRAARAWCWATWPGPTSRRWRASPSSSPATASTSGATIPSTSTGGSISPATATSSSSTRWRPTSSAISFSTSAPRCATARGRSRSCDYAAQMIAALGYAVRPPERQGLAGHLRRRDPRASCRRATRMAQIVRMTELLDQTEPVQKTRMADA